MKIATSWLVPVSVVVCISTLVNVHPAASAAPPPDDDWHLTTELALWATSASGSAGIKGIQTDVDVNFADIFNDLDFGAMGDIALYKGNWVFLIDGVYAKLGDDKQFSDGRGGSFTSEMGIADFSLGYTIVRTEIGGGGGGGRGMPLKFTPAIGVRYTYLSIDLNPNQFPTFSDHREWWDPYVGGQVILGLTPKLDWRTQGSWGGWGIGSDSVWSAGTYFDWHFQDNMFLTVGYVATSWDYDDGGFKWDMTLYGPWIGFTIKWF
jgi:hypothetical protein